MSIMPQTPPSLAPMYESTASSSPETISTRAPQAASHRSVNSPPVRRVAHRAGGKNKNLLRAVAAGALRQLVQQRSTEDCMLSSVSLPPISPANRRVPRRSRRTSHKPARPSSLQPAGGSRSTRFQCSQGAWRFPPLNPVRIHQNQAAARSRPNCPPDR